MFGSLHRLGNDSVCIIKVLSQLQPDGASRIFSNLVII